MTHSAQLDARLRPHPRARVRRADEESRLAHGFPDASFEFSQRALAFSPDGARLLWTTSRAPYAQTAAAGSGRGATLGDAARGSAPGRHRGQAVSAALSPDGRFVVTGGADRLALLWELVQAPLPRRRRAAAAPRRLSGGAQGEGAGAPEWRLERRHAVLQGAPVSAVAWGRDFAGNAARSLAAGLAQHRRRPALPPGVWAPPPRPARPPAARGDARGAGALAPP